MDRQAEVERLAQTDRHIATAEQHITKQRLLIDNLRADGHDTKVAEEMLTGFDRACAATNSSASGFSISAGMPAAMHSMPLARIHLQRNRQLSCRRRRIDDRRQYRLRPCENVRCAACR